MCRAPLRHRSQTSRGLACKSLTNTHQSPRLRKLSSTTFGHTITGRRRGRDESPRSLDAADLVARRTVGMRMATNVARTTAHDPRPTSPDGFRVPKYRSSRSSHVPEAGSQAVRERPRAHTGRRSRRCWRRHQRVSPLVARADRRESGNAGRRSLGDHSPGGLRRVCRPCPARASDSVKTSA